MDLTIKVTVDLLVHNAEYLLDKYGLLFEAKILEMIKTASDLVWDNAQPETDLMWVYWMTDKEIYISECIGELHGESARKYLLERKRTV